MPDLSALVRFSAVFAVAEHSKAGSSNAWVVTPNWVAGMCQRVPWEAGKLGPAPGGVGGHGLGGCSACSLLAAPVAPVLQGRGLSSPLQGVTALLRFDPGILCRDDGGGGEQPGQTWSLSAV